MSVRLTLTVAVLLREQRDATGSQVNAVQDVQLLNPSAADFCAVQVCDAGNSWAGPHIPGTIRLVMPFTYDDVIPDKDASASQTSQCAAELQHCHCRLWAFERRTHPTGVSGTVRASLAYRRHCQSCILELHDALYLRYTGAANGTWSSAAAMNLSSSSVQIIGYACLIVQENHGI